jgi:Na+/H+ antiporter NhaD/arsenite permease-like protein
MGDTLSVSDAVRFTPAFITATLIFVLAYVLIVSERIHKTIIALTGAAIMIVLGIITQEEAFNSIEFGVDWNVIFLLLAMMVIINIMRPTGVFEYIAIRSAKLARGRPFRIMAIFSIVTAFLSAFLDNVTTVLLIAPVTLLICQALEIDAVPYLITEAIASNIGGTATLIGDPPNIMIASKADLTFIDFIFNLSPVVIVILAVYVLTLWLVFGKRLSVREELRLRVMAMDENEAIRDKRLLIKSLVVIILTMTGFVFHGMLHMEPATIALSGAALLLLISGTENPHKLFAEVEWSTLFFFIGLFIIIGAIVKVGLIKWLSVKLLMLTQGNLFGTSMAVLWFSAFASAFVDNIPYVATMNPLIINMAKQLWPDLTGSALLHNPGLMPVWWSLALGACLGGNGTAIGASANVIVVGIAEKMDRPISFARFMLYGMPLMIESVIISMLYIWLRYYVFQ